LAGAGEVYLDYHRDREIRLHVADLVADLNRDSNHV